MSNGEVRWRQHCWMLCGIFLKVFMSLVVKRMVVQGGVMISKLPKKTQGVSVIYDWTNIIYRVSGCYTIMSGEFHCGKDRKRRGSERNSIPLLCFV